MRKHLYTAVWAGLILTMLFVMTLSSTSMVRANPDTFGYTEPPEEPMGGRAAINGIIGNWFTCPGSGYVNSISAYILNYEQWDTGHMKCAIYRRNDNSFVAGTEELVFPGYYPGEPELGWKTFNFDVPPALTPQDYWLVVWGDSNTDDMLVGLTTIEGTQQESYMLIDYDSWPSTLSMTDVDDHMFSLYCTYTPSIPSNPPNPPTSLLCCGRTNPIDLDTYTPYFSAICTEDGGGTFTHFAIQVDDDPGFGSPIWDWGKITLASTFDSGGRSPNIIYMGSDLKKDVTYFWRIKFWDSDGGEGSWSTEIAYFVISSEELKPISRIIPVPAILLCLVIGMVIDFAYLYYKVADIHNIRSGAEGLKGIFIFLLALILIWGVTIGLLQA